uniref:Uncharacterized protein n=1 Tax=Ciona intestinalis TaxID=7719 RepID=H2Y128_CIOIN
MVLYIFECSLFTTKWDEKLELIKIVSYSLTLLYVLLITQKHD